MKALVSPLVIASFLLAGCAHQRTEGPISFLGAPSSESATTETIVIRPETKWVNVTGGDTVRFVVGERVFVWAFNVESAVTSVDLQRVAPSGMLDRQVKAYIAPNPLYKGGDSRS